MTDRIPCPTMYPERKTWYAGMKETDPPVVTYNVPCGGTLHPCPICGEVRYCGREARCLDDQVDTHWARHLFSLDDETLGQLPAWTRGERWNGWGCPRFEFAEAMRYMAFGNANAGYGQMTYDANQDVFSCVLEGNEPSDVEHFAATTITTPDGPKKVYAIGAWSWTWNEQHPLTPTEMLESLREMHARFQTTDATTEREDEVLAVLITAAEIAAAHKPTTRERELEAQLRQVLLGKVALREALDAVLNEFIAAMDHGGGADMRRFPAFDAAQKLIDGERNHQ